MGLLGRDAATVAQGNPWPIGRTTCFLVGLGFIAVATVSGLAAYDDVLLSAHMVQHMLLAMIAPVFLALGAPVTLALRTLPRRGRRILLAILHSPVAKFFTFPVVSFALFVASPFVLYFSGLYRLSLENDLVHNLVHLHFVIVGCLFLWPLIGLDPLPGRMPYPLRALLMFLSTPFHTVLGLTVMQSADLLAGTWYPNLELGWADPHTDQQLAGGILWAGGEFVAVTMLAALVAQWIRQSGREERRVDRDRRPERRHPARPVPRIRRLHGPAARGRPTHPQGPADLLRRRRRAVDRRTHGGRRARASRARPQTRQGQRQRLGNGI